MSKMEWQIVVIDDEPDIREVMRMTLADAGYTVHEAADGQAGIDMCERQQPQIVITDIRMPGLDGIEVLTRLKVRMPETEVIVATAFGDMQVAIRALQLDASDFITKPINDTELHLALGRARERFLNRKKVADYTALLESENAKTSRELIKTFRFQKNLIESSMDGIVACDGSGRVVTYNKAMENLLGYTQSDVVRQRRFDDLFPPGEATHIRAHLDSHQWGGRHRLYLYESRLRDRRGLEIPVQISASVLFEGEQKNGLVCYIRDLRTIRELEQEVVDQARLLHQDKMMSLGRLAASVVHEINNPLSGVLNYLRLMLEIIDRGPLAEAYRQKFRHYLNLVETETDRCSKIVGNLLSFSRKSPAVSEPVNMAEAIERCVVLSQHKLTLSNINLEKDVPADLPPVRGDFSQLQQCLINLIFNAIDAMPEGGRLALEARLEAHIENAKREVRIIVADSGVGIAPIDIDHIFDPFFTTKKAGHGVGLGLSTVYGIIERHNGAISVTSKPDKGTRFVIDLPAL